MQPISPNDFEVNLDSRRAKHAPSGISFTFYEYRTEDDWRDAGPSHLMDNPAWPGDRKALALAAKSAALAAGMAARRRFQFEVVREGLRDGNVWFWGTRDREVVLGAVSTEALEDDADPVQRELSDAQLIALASANVEPIGRLLNAKIAAGETTQPAPEDKPRVYVQTGDLRRAGVRLSTSILTAGAITWGGGLAKVK